MSTLSRLGGAMSSISKKLDSANDWVSGVGKGLVDDGAGLLKRGEDLLGAKLPAGAKDNGISQGYRSVKKYASDVRNDDVMYDMIAGSAMQGAAMGAAGSLFTDAGFFESALMGGMAGGALGGIGGSRASKMRGMDDGQFKAARKSSDAKYNAYKTNKAEFTQKFQTDNPGASQKDLGKAISSNEDLMKQKGGLGRNYNTYSELRTTQDHSKTEVFKNLRRTAASVGAGTTLAYNTLDANDALPW